MIRRTSLNEPSFRRIRLPFMCRLVWLAALADIKPPRGGKRRYPAWFVFAAVSQDASPSGCGLVIVNYRTPALVLHCLQTVRATASELDLHVVIVDNGSGDGSAEQIRTELPEATVVACDDNRGFAAGVNAGLRATTGEFAIVLNPDTEVLSGALQALLACLSEHPRTAVAAPLLENEDGSLQVSGYRRFPGLFTLFVELCVPLGYAFVRMPRFHPYAMTPAALLAGERPAHVYGAALAIRLQAYKQAGDLDEGFFLYLEETDWQSRLVAAGWEIELVPQARVRHLVRGGGQAALAPSPHFIASALRYLGLRGVSPLLARLSLAAALALSWLTLSGIALLPSKRRHATVQARAYRSLLIQTLRGADG